MKAWWQPSLVRRLVLALLVAFALVWGVLLMNEFADLRAGSGNSSGLRRLVEALAASLPAGVEGSDGALARRIVQAGESQYNRLRQDSPLADPGDLLFRLEGANGALVYASPLLAGFDAQAPGAAAPIRVAGRLYRGAWAATPHWRLLVLEPVIADSVVLRFLGNDLAGSLLIAFPLVLLPLWLAVRRGLQPLRRLVQGVQARSPADFSPLGFNLEYAELQPLAQAIDALLEKARLGIEREKAFVQDAAHELRTPLAVIDAQAHRLAGARDGAEQAAARLALEQAVGRAAHLVQQLLTLAALDGTPPGESPAVDLVDAARRIVIAALPLAAARDIEVTLDSPERLVARLEASAFHSILGNLLDNAIAYCPSGARVEIGLMAADGGIRLSVADNGSGIPPAEQARIFERFYRGQAGARTPGAGLGLAIVRQALERLGGRLALCPGLAGRGVAFVLDFPA